MHQKYQVLWGHSDILGELWSPKAMSFWEKIRVRQRVGGGGSISFWLHYYCLASKDVPYSYERSCRTAGVLADYLTQLLGVEQVYYPGWKKSSWAWNSQLIKWQVLGVFLSFQVKVDGLKANKSWFQKLIFTNATSLGGVVKVFIERRAASEGPNTVNSTKSNSCFCGLENLDDLWEDLDQAFTTRSELINLISLAENHLLYQSPSCPLEDDKKLK